MQPPSLHIISRILYAGAHDVNHHAILTEDNVAKLYTLVLFQLKRVYLWNVTRVAST
jgi:hypothetical protein